MELIYKHAYKLLYEVFKIIKIIELLKRVLHLVVVVLTRKKKFYGAINTEVKWL